ncbi:hypothetical protein CK222_26200 [Mesorhizobium sp. WSM3866]|nr:hypothetical protein CK222_26200 [Mesorhizobium sp. WSM3866]PBB58349.1 hypothetical protein CK217_30335 [Mesorhizobium loti]PBB83425.1 hypothetical protein CK216_28880 [Mesorhizobium sp. WSM3876]
MPHFVVDKLVALEPGVANTTMATLLSGAEQMVECAAMAMVDDVQNVPKARIANDDVQRFMGPPRDSRW